MPILLRVASVNPSINLAVIVKLNEGHPISDPNAFVAWLTQNKIQLTDACLEAQHQAVMGQLMAFYPGEPSPELEAFLAKQAIDFREGMLVEPVKPNHAPHLIAVQGKPHGTVYTGTDVHGCLPLLETIGQQILTQPQDLFIHTGDAVDRGPSSFAIVEYLLRNKHRIICLRGNHEDWALGAIHFLNVIEAVRHRHDNPTSFAAMAGSGFYHDLLSDLSDTQLDSLVTQYDALKQAFYNEKSTSGKDLYRNQNYVLGKFNEFYRKPFISLTEERIKQFFCSFISTVYNGAEWTMDLAPSQRQTVETFIDELPYGIKLTGYYQGDQWIDDPKYFFHAAPLSTEVIETRLLDKNPTLLAQEIAYCTLARPDVNASKSEPVITAQGRNSQSIEAFVGHNSASAHAAIFAQTNIVDLDMQSVDSNILLIVNLNKRQLCLILGPGQTFEKDGLVIAPMRALQKKFNQPCMIIYGYSVRANPRAPSSTSLTAESVSDDRLPAKKNAAPEWDVVVEHANWLEKAAETLNINNKSDLKIIKANFIAELAYRVTTLSPEQCGALVEHLLHYDQHPLARERNCIKERYTHETDSMHQAVSLLLQRQRPPSVSLHVAKSCSGTVATVTLPVDQGNQSFTFARRTKHFDLNNR